MSDAIQHPLVVGIGGTTRSSSSSEAALDFALKAAESCGARTLSFGGNSLSKLPMYDPSTSSSTCISSALLTAIREASGVIVASPGYNGTVSGLVKNALDYMEDLRDCEPSYWSGKAAGCIAVAAGWQSAVGTLQTLRSISHALRAWPTPMGVAINSSGGTFLGGTSSDAVRAREQLSTLATQVVAFCTTIRTPPDYASA